MRRSASMRAKFAARSWAWLIVWVWLMVWAWLIGWAGAASGKATPRMRLASKLERRRKGPEAMAIGIGFGKTIGNYDLN